MSLDHDEPEEEYEEDEAPRSIFSAAWFRVVLVVLVLGVVGAIAIPYVLDVVNAPPTTTTRVSAPPVPEGAGRAVTTPAEPAKPLSPTPVPPATSPAPATAKEVPAAPAAARSVEPAKRASAKSAEPAKRVERAKAVEPAKPTDQSNASRVAKEPPARGERVVAARSVASEAKDGGSGDFFVQVGAFKDEGTAKQVVARLREQNYPVAESVKPASAPSAEAPKTTPRAPSAMPGDRYDVLVSGGAATEINTKLAAKGLASEPLGDGVRIRPSLPLREAVALSKDLGSEGFKVQVKRGGGASVAAAPTASRASDAPMLHRVRVGGYPDRATAQAVLRELRDKGYDAFIAKGRD